MGANESGSKSEIQLRACINNTPRLIFPSLSGDVVAKMKAFEGVFKI